jgi:hypothetical protein
VGVIKMLCKITIENLNLKSRLWAKEREIKELNNRIDFWTFEWRKLDIQRSKHEKN